MTAANPKAILIYVRVDSIPLFLEFRIPINLVSVFLVS